MMEYKDHVYRLLVGLIIFTILMVTIWLLDTSKLAQKVMIGFLLFIQCYMIGFSLIMLWRER